MLTDRQVRDTKAVARVQLGSDHTGGLTLMVQRKRTDGKPAAKTWIWRARIAGKIRTVKIGRAEVMNADTARTRAMEISRSVLAGKDPHREAKTAKVLSKIIDEPINSAITVSQAWKLYMKAEGDSRKTAREKERLFQKDAAPRIGAMAITAITSDDLARVVNDVAKRAPVTGDRLQANLSPFFKWAASSRGRLDTGLTTNPMVGVEKPHGRIVKRMRGDNKDERHSVN